MIYGSVCSGIEAATAAWHPLGWEPAFFSEIDPFPCAVLSHHYPDTPLHGDFTTIGANEYGSIDLLVGGTPCQSFSIAGLRKGLDDDRGNLALEYLRLAQRETPKWLVWENVPGVLSSNGGRDFGAFLGALAELGYGFAYRVLDAQYFGVAQRRRRVFVVGYAGDWRRAAAVLFERESLSRNPAPSREAGKKVAATSGERLAVSSGRGWMRTFSGNQESPVAGTLETTCHDYSRADSFNVAVSGYVDCENNAVDASQPLGPLMAGSPSGGGRPLPAVAFAQNSRNDLRESQVFGAISTGGGKLGQGYPAVRQGHSVRRLTPIECERLQGLPDNFTQIPYRNKPADKCPDGARYKALGNSMAVPVMRWIGERIQLAENLKN